MKLAWPLFSSVLLLAPALGACSSNDPAADAGTDAPSPQDAATDARKSDAGPTDAGGNDAAQTDGGGDSGGPVDGGIACTAPCPSMSTPECCGQIVAAQGSPPACFFAGTYSTQCKPTCNTLINPSCGSTSDMRVCEKKADCIEANYDQCCTVTINSTPLSLCMSALQAQIAGATCK
jgi:hypothetical protein